MKLTDCFRWWLFQRATEFGWWVCPTVPKKMLQDVYTAGRAALAARKEEGGE